MTLENTPTSRHKEWRFLVILVKVGSGDEALVHRLIAKHYQGVLNGCFLALCSISIFVVERQTHILFNGFDLPVLTVSEQRAMVFILLSSIGSLPIWVIKTDSWPWSIRPKLISLLLFIVSQVLATLSGVYGVNESPAESGFNRCGWSWALLIWVYTMFVFLLLSLLDYGLKRCISCLRSRG